MKQRLITGNFLLVLSFFLLTGCAGFFVGKENLSAPVALPKIPNTVTFDTVWQKKVGNGTGLVALSLRPVIVGNRVFVVSSDGKLKALDLTSGRVIWQKKVGHTIISGVSANQNLVVVGDKNGLLMAFSSADGRAGWTYQMSTETLAPVNIISDRVIARAVNGQVVALDARTGLSVWKQYLGVADLSIRGNARGLLLSDVVLFVNSQGRLNILSVADGRSVFSQALVMGKGATVVSQVADLVATPVVRNRVLFVSAYRQKTLAINLRDGKLLWQSPHASTKDLFADGNNLYLVDKNSVIYALALRDGQQVWRKKTLEGRRISPVLGSDHWLSTVDQEGFLILLDSRDGKYLGRVKVGGAGAFVAPVETKNGLLTYTADGTLTLTHVNRD